MMTADKKKPIQLALKTSLDDKVLSTTADADQTVRAVLQMIGQLTPHDEDGIRVQQQVKRELSSSHCGFYAVTPLGGLTPIDPAKKFDELGIVVPREVTTLDGASQTIQTCVIELQAYAPVGR